MSLGAQALQKNRGPIVRSLDRKFDADNELRVDVVGNPIENRTLGDINIFVRIAGPKTFPRCMLTIPFTPDALSGIIPASVRTYLFDDATGVVQPQWQSSINITDGFIWSKITRSGVYIPIGLPADFLICENLRDLAFLRRRNYDERPDDLTQAGFSDFLRRPLSEISMVRNLTARVLASPAKPMPGRRSQRSTPLPKNATVEEFRRRIAELTTREGGLPEEQLFFSPDLAHASSFPWQSRDHSIGINPHAPSNTKIKKLPTGYYWGGISYGLPGWSQSPLSRLIAPDWPMYHLDAYHSGLAQGASQIWSTTVSEIAPTEYSPINLSGSIISTPIVVDGKIYVGTTSATSGTLYRIDLKSGKQDPQGVFTFADTAFTQGSGSNQGYGGIGSSPAYDSGRIYFSGLDGKIYCLDALDFSNPIWVTDLRNNGPGWSITATHPLSYPPNSLAEGWSSPLVVDGFVYVGFGLGEDQTGPVAGFVFCLDARSGDIQWLFCTNQFVQGQENQPNTIPASYTTSPPPPGFSALPDPQVLGSAVWSSLAYDSSLDTVFVGTGNPAGAAAQGVKYGGGVLALDAKTGTFKGWFQPSLADNYRPDDSDVDVAAAPCLYTYYNSIDGSEPLYLAIGTKSGAFFVLDAATMNVVARRNLLPVDAGGNPLPSIDPRNPGDSTENTYGVFACAAGHPNTRYLFVGLGGYNGKGSIDFSTTPFMRVVDQKNLDDTWTTSGVLPTYAAATPPMYSNAGECGLSSPAIVHDVVFMATTLPAMYAFDVESGILLWTAPDLSAPGAFGPTQSYTLGPAIFGDYVVLGRDDGTLHVYAMPQS